MSTRKATAAVLRAEEKKSKAAGKPATHHRIGHVKAPIAPALAAEVEKLKADLEIEKKANADLDRERNQLVDELARTRTALIVSSDLLTKAANDARYYHERLTSLRFRDEDIPF